MTGCSSFGSKAMVPLSRDIRKLRTYIKSAVVRIVLTVIGPVHGAMGAGTGHVIDGDTIAIDAARIRLHSIETPETGQRCALTDGHSWRCDEAATAALAAMTKWQRISRDVRDVGTYGRLVPVSHALGLDVGQAACWRWPCVGFRAIQRGFNRPAIYALRSFFMVDGRSAGQGRNSLTNCRM